MRNKFLLQPMLWAMMIVLFACQKDPIKDNSNDLLISKVNTWLDKQKSTKQPNKAANIDLLKENINFSALKFEDLSTNEQFLVIPINENYKMKKNIDKNIHPVLLLVQDKTGNILRGNIVLYIPENNQQMNHIPDNTFSKMYAEKDLDCSGMFRFLSPTGRWMHQREYKNKKLYSFGYVKADNTYEARTTTECTHYVLNLFLWEDGVIVDQATIYLGFICENDCDNSQNQTLCPDDANEVGGDGGGGSGEVACCIPDANLQFTSDQTNITSDDCGLIGVNPITGNPTKTCTHTWTFHKWHLLWYNWDFTCFTNTGLEKESGLWKFKTIAFQGVTRSGQLPACVSSNCTVNAANPSISADELMAKLILNYTIENRVTCYPWWSPDGMRFSIQKDWSPSS